MSFGGPDAAATVAHELVRVPPAAAAAVAHARASRFGPQSHAKTLGLNVVRCWAFNDGSRAGALQPTPGGYDEAVLRSLDAVVAGAPAAGVRLLLTLTNNWGDYGGAPQYVAWARQAGESLDSSDGATA